MESKTEIETERLILRPTVESDADDIYEYARDENVGVHAGWQPHKNIEETRQIMNVIFIDKENVFAIVLKASGKVIGSVGVIDDPKREYDQVKMIGYALGHDYWGKGYMTEAAKALVAYSFDTLKLEMISAYCYPYNERSRNILLKLGFKFEGKLSLCEKSFNGEVYDNECYALMRE